MRSAFKNATKLIAVTLAVLTAALTPAAFLGENKVFAASERKKYIKEVRVFSKTHGDKDDAKKWCDSQPENKDGDPDNDWAVLSDDLDKGGSGALKKSVGVYLCYTTTTNPNEAVRDLAVMNENGNYSEGEYERILSEQRDMYIDLVNNSKTMLDEYRANYQSGLPTAVQAHDLLNTYREDDSGKLFGDFMLNVSDDDLVDVLLQANGQAVLTLQEQLAYACDTGKSTWLDRMTQLGSYETLRKQAYKACNNDYKKADKALKQKYSDTANLIYESWDDIYQHFQNIENFAEKNGLNDMSDSERDAYFAAKKQEAENNTLDTETYAFLQEHSSLAALSAYEYDGKSLSEYFNRAKEGFSGDNIKELYPLAASLSKGQLAGLAESVSLYSLLLDAQSATASNPYKKGMKAKLEQVDAETKKETEDMLDNQKKTLDKWKNVEPVSIYEGVERGVYSGSVAVTSTAKQYSRSTSKGWFDSFSKGEIIFNSACFGFLSLISAGMSIVTARAANSLSVNIVKLGIDKYACGGEHLRVIDDALAHFSEKRIMEGADFVEKINVFASPEVKQEITELTNARKLLLKKGLENSKNNEVARYTVFRRMEIGFAVLAIIIAAIDITLTIIALHEYYNRSHLPIPKYMVDLSYNEDLETSFIAYRGVLDDDGDQGDLNGGGGKQWLALYASYEEDAGDPILAPDGDLHKGITQRGKDTIPDGYSPLHFFGKPNAPQNLTFADGEDGWSYNDNEGGTYFFFERDKNWRSADASNAATAMSFGMIALIGGLGVLIGFAVATCVFILIVKRKREKI